MDVTIREATVADADAMGAVHVRAWQAAYRGMMLDEYLDALDPTSRADMWRRIIEENRAGIHRVVIEAESVIVGLAAYGPDRDPASDPSVGELIAINLHPDHWRRGLGRRLIRQVTTELAGQGFTRAVLWVVTENTRARTFYESEAWYFDGTARIATVQDAIVNEVRYARDLTGDAGVRGG